MYVAIRPTVNYPLLAFQAFKTGPGEANIAV